MSPSGMAIIFGLLAVAAAYGLWRSRVNVPGQSTETRIFDGGFEDLSPASLGGFGWTIDDDLPSLSISADTTTAKSGATSLRMEFAGDTPLNAPVISQLVRVKPQNAYVLSFAYRTDRLVSAGLPFVVVSDRASKEVLAAFEIGDTRGEWKRAVLDFRSRSAPVVTVSVQRLGCSQSPCPIFGGVGLDDFEIVPQRRGN